MIETKPFDAAIFLTTPEAQDEFLAAARESDDPDYVLEALATVARARSMTDVARDAGITREGLYKALGPKGDPKLSTLTRIAAALGYRLTFERIPDAPKP